MSEIIEKDSPKESILQFKARIENGVIIPEESVSIPTSGTYWVIIQLEPSLAEDPTIDALAKIAEMAQNLGPTDLARNFDIYTDRIVNDESTD